jgi:hypothetical protein
MALDMLYDSIAYFRKVRRGQPTDQCALFPR